MDFSVFRRAAAALAAAASVEASAGAAREASPAFGGSLVLPDSTVFSVSFFEPAFAAGHGAVDGAAPGAFRLRTGAGGRETDMHGTAEFAEGDGGAIRAA
ncbi:MAG: hypothetical protein IJ678_01630, partial [Kiritimatiellae bacterium]|nr:hypothetical protein [Kiritimatiellia bacterium]